MRVRGSLGRSGTGLVSIVVATLLLAGLPAHADPTPSPSPTASPRADGDKTAADTKTPDPSPDPTTEPDPHDSAALIEATAALQQAQADLLTARTSLTTARAELATAQAADAAAQEDLQTAVESEQRALRDLGAVRTRLTLHETNLGRLARSAYVGQGMLGEWALLLDSSTPHQLADKLATLQSVASAGNSVIAALEQDRADLTNTLARLTASRQEQEAARAAAHQALLDKTAKEQEATQAEQQVGLVVQIRATALAAAQAAIGEDKVQYHQMQVESGALATRITSMAAKLAKTKHPPHGTGHFTRPGRGVITSPYGPRYHPILHYVKVHTGIDFAAADGISYAADDGVVLITEFNVAYGNMTVIDHGTVGGLHITTLYAHQAAFGVRPGDRVVKGQPIGVIGETGYATGPHLHFEVRIDGSPVDPAPFLKNAPMPPVLRGPGRVAAGA